MADISRSNSLEQCFPAAVMVEAFWVNVLARAVTISGYLDLDSDTEASPFVSFLHSCLNDAGASLDIEECRNIALALEAMDWNIEEFKPYGLR